MDTYHTIHIHTLTPATQTKHWFEIERHVPQCPMAGDISDYKPSMSLNND